MEALAGVGEGKGSGCHNSSDAVDSIPSALHVVPAGSPAASQKPRKERGRSLGCATAKKTAITPTCEGGTTTHDRPPSPPPPQEIDNDEQERSGVVGWQGNGKKKQIAVGVGVSVGRVVVVVVVVEHNEVQAEAEKGDTYTTERRGRGGGVRGWPLSGVGDGTGDRHSPKRHKQWHPAHRRETCQEPTNK